VPFSISGVIFKVVMVQQGWETPSVKKYLILPTQFWKALQTCSANQSRGNG
jgi:hypothetical protein